MSGPGDFWYDEALAWLGGDDDPTLDDLDPDTFNEAVGDALGKLDGSTASAVSLLTGLSPERLDEVGGFVSCPQCGGHVRRWYAASFVSEGDVDPRAQCDDCEWGY